MRPEDAQRARTSSGGSRPLRTSSARTSVRARSKTGHRTFRPGPPPRLGAHQRVRPGRAVQQTGPDSTGSGIAYGGLLHLTGDPDRPPVRPGVTVSDYLTGVFAARGRRSPLSTAETRCDGGDTGRGAVVDASLYGSVLRILEWTIAGYDRWAPSASARETASPTRRLSTTTRRADGQFVCIVGASDANFARLCKATRDVPIFTPIHASRPWPTGRPTPTTINGIVA